MISSMNKDMYRFISDAYFPDCTLDGLLVAFVLVDDFVLFSVNYCNPSSLLVTRSVVC